MRRLPCLFDPPPDTDGKTRETRRVGRHSRREVRGRTAEISRRRETRGREGRRGCGDPRRKVNVLKIGHGETRRTERKMDVEAMAVDTVRREG